MQIHYGNLQALGNKIFKVENSRLYLNKTFEINENYSLLKRMKFEIHIPNLCVIELNLYIADPKAFSHLKY